MMFELYTSDLFKVVDVWWSILKKNMTMTLKKSLSFFKFSFWQIQKNCFNLNNNFKNILSYVKMYLKG